MRAPGSGFPPRPPDDMAPAPRSILRAALARGRSVQISTGIPRPNPTPIHRRALGDGDPPPQGMGGAGTPPRSANGWREPPRTVAPLLPRPPCRPDPPPRPRRAGVPRGIPGRGLVGYAPLMGAAETLTPFETLRSGTRGGTTPPPEGAGSAVFIARSLRG